MNYKVIFFLVCLSNVCVAQQEPLTTMFWNNYSIYNPAATGVFNKYYASSTSRIQWTDLQGSPKTQSVLFDYKVDKINSGVGLNYVYDQIGFEKSNKINLNYAYHLKLKKERLLTAGLSFGYENVAINFKNIVALSLYDPYIPSIAHYNFFNFGAGFLFKTPHLLVGASATQLNEYSAPFYKKSRHLNFCTIGNLNISKKVALKPGIFYRYVSYANKLEGNIRLVFDKKYWIGATYRMQNSKCFMAGIDIKEKFRISYAYDHFESKLINYGATHELGLVLMLN